MRCIRVGNWSLEFSALLDPIMSGADDRELMATPPRDAASVCCSADRSRAPEYRAPAKVVTRVRLDPEVASS